MPSSDVARVTEADPLSMEGAADMVKFSALTEAALLHNIRVRYARDQIYSSAGSILISVNPFKTLPIYTEDLMARCKACDAKGLQELPPHVYALAEAAFRGMLVERKPQAILITGESGAGKTEAAKYAVQYIVARSSAGRDGVTRGKEAEQARRIETCILQANPPRYARDIYPRYTRDI